MKISRTAFAALLSAGVASCGLLAAPLFAQQGVGALGDGVVTVQAPGAEGKNIVETAKAAGSFKTLLKAATEAGLVDALTATDKKLTVFAPTDSAFGKIPEKDLNALLADKEKLKAVLLYHVVEGEVMAADVLKLDGEKVKTLSGKEIMVSVDGKKVMLNENVKVTKTDIGASNGVIHVVNTVLMPPMDED